VPCHGAQFIVHLPRSRAAVDDDGSAFSSRVSGGGKTRGKERNNEIPCVEIFNREQRRLTDRLPRSLTRDSLGDRVFRPTSRGGREEDASLPPPPSLSLSRCTEKLQSPARGLSAVELSIRANATSRHGRRCAASAARVCSACVYTRESPSFTFQPGA